MHTIRLPMPTPARPSQESTSPQSLPMPRASLLTTRDHRDDGSAIGGLIVMLSAALPLWIMIIVLLVWLPW